jgi:phosphomannomutase
VKELKIGTSWVRGVVGEALTPELIVDFACAFGTWCNGGAVVIGRDTRRSSPALRAAVTAGLLSTGCEVIDLGVSPSPLLSFAVRELATDGGISITGGHNDAAWNALKFVGPDGALLNSAKSEELLDIYHASKFLLASWDRIRPIAHDGAVLERYLDHLLAPLDVETIRSRPMRVAMDFCNGACAPVAARFLEELGCTLLPVNDDPTGEFAHPPAPSKANMRQLAALMRLLHADIGAAINVDGDRIGFVTGEGEALSEEYALPLAAAVRLKRRPGPVATNLSTSRMIDSVAERYGQRVIRTSVGESHVIDQGLVENASLAGEGSGGVAALPVSMMFDGLLTLGFVLEQMASTGDSLSGLVAKLPSYTMRKFEMPCPPNLVYKVLDRFRLDYADQIPDCSDGVCVKLSDAWLHVRASNTEPMLRIIVEAEDRRAADEHLERALTLARRATYSHGGS